MWLWADIAYYPQQLVTKLAKEKDKKMVTIEQLERWLKLPSENEHLEFKKASEQFDSTKLLKYCVALANEGGGHFASKTSGCIFIRRG